MIWFRCPLCNERNGCPTEFKWRWTPMRDCWNCVRRFAGAAEKRAA